MTYISVILIVHLLVIIKIIKDAYGTCIEMIVLCKFLHCSTCIGSLRLRASRFPRIYFFSGPRNIFKRPSHMASRQSKWAPSLYPMQTPRTSHVSIWRNKFSNIYNHWILHTNLCTSYYYYYYRYSVLGPVWAETRVQSGDWYGSGRLHPGQVLRGSLPLLSPAF